MTAYLNSIPVNGPVQPGFSTGLIPRNYSKHPVGSYEGSVPFPESELIPENEWADRLAQNRAEKSGLLDLRETYYEYLKSLDQDGLGLCWNFSTTKNLYYARKVANLPDVFLSPWYVAGKINGWRDQGGWGAASMDYAIKTGLPSLDKCPSYDRKYDTPEAAADCALHKVTEWWDGSDDPRMAQRQLVSMLLKKISCVVDLNDMGHSMNAIDIKSLNPLQIVYDNSWAESGGNKGLYIGQGARAMPDGLVIGRVTTA